MSITKQSYNMLAQIHAECFAHREPQADELPDTSPAPRYSNFRRTIGYKESKPQTAAVDLRPVAGEISLKSFINQEMEKDGITYSGVIRRIYDGWYRDRIIIRRVTRNTQFVRVL